MSKTKVIIQSKDGHQVTHIFETYAEASAFIKALTQKLEIEISLKEYHATKSPTVEVYEEKK